MATAAQIEANRRNAQKSTGPRTEAGKSRSRFNALDHGCRANILVLPSEEFGDYENQCRTWKLSFKPRNPGEDFLIDAIVSLGCLGKRIDQAQTARLTKRMHCGVFEEDDAEAERVIELGQKLFRNARGPEALYLEDEGGEPNDEGEFARISDYDNDEEQPMRLVHQLKACGAGCEWLLDQWTELRKLLEEEQPWLAPDKLKAVRLLGRHPIDALDSADVAKIYLASHVLLNDKNPPFRDILNELSPDERPRFESYLRMRRYERLAPKDAAAARAMLVEIVDRVTDELEDKAGVFRELAEIDLKTAGLRLSWDDTPEGERLRRYELTCKRSRLRMFELLLKVRDKGAELGIATIASIERSVPTVTIDEIDPLAPFVADEMTAPEGPVREPEPPIEANSSGENAPNEPNSRVQEISSGRQDGGADFRIDNPHTERRSGGTHRSAKAASHPAFDRAMGSRQPTLLNLSPIFGQRPVE